MCNCQRRCFDTEKCGVGKWVSIWFECGKECKCVEGEIVGCTKTPCCGDKAIKIKDCYGTIFNIDCDKISYWTTKECDKKDYDRKDYDGYDCGRKDYDGCDCGGKDYDRCDCGRKDYDGCDCERCPARGSCGRKACSRCGCGRKDYDGHDCGSYDFGYDDCDCCD